MTPEAVVQRQLDAYNARDLDAFVACYADDVELFRMPSPQPALRGLAALAEFYATERFTLPGLRADLLNRMVLGDKVIDHERVHGVRDVPFEAAVAYEVATYGDSRLRSVTLGGVGAAITRGGGIDRARCAREALTPRPSRARTSVEASHATRLLPSTKLPFEVCCRPYAGAPGPSELRPVGMPPRSASKRRRTTCLRASMCPPTLTLFCSP